MNEAEKRQNEYINQTAERVENRYDFKKAEKDAYRLKKGLTPKIVEELSAKKNDPEWMREFRLRSLEIYHSLDVPPWGPSIDDLNIDNIVTYVKPNTDMQGSWKNVPEDIKDTFDKLGIPQAEQKSLAGVGAQYDSEVVYHNLKEEVAKLGVIYTDIETALKGPYEPMIREHFMKLVTPRDHKFAALHGAVWSGGSFVYVPPGVKVDIPLQSYFRLNAAGAGQFEHTLIIVDKGADLHFIEGCSAPKYNVANLHAGCVELFVADDASLINTKSISKDGGASTFRSSVVVAKQAQHSKALVSCQSLMLDNISRSDTIPAMDVRTNKASVGHEAKIGRISDQAVFYLMSRGLSEAAARAMIVNGFANPISKELPVEYAVEMNHLIQLEMEGAIG